MPNVGLHCTKMHLATGSARTKGAYSTPPYPLAGFGEGRPCRGKGKIRINRRRDMGKGKGG